MAHLWMIFPLKPPFIFDDNSAATTQMAQSEAALILPRVRSKWLKIYRDELGRNGHRQKRDHSAIHDESMLQHR